MNTHFLILSPLFIRGRNANQHLADSFVDSTDGTSKPSVSNTSAGTDSGANGNSTTSHPTIKKDSAQPSSADEAGVTKLPEDRPATSEVITAAAASTAAASSATDKDASSKGNAGKFQAPVNFSLKFCHWFRCITLCYSFVRLPSGVLSNLWTFFLRAHLCSVVDVYDISEACNMR